MKEISFVKMHGAGNDFIVVQDLTSSIDWGKLDLKQICHRRFGVGCDQFLVVKSSEIADFKMEIYNSDGSQVEMCGNGIRCVAKFLFDQKLTEKRTLAIETLAGIIRPTLLLDHPQNSNTTLQVKVDMGPPEFMPEKIPAKFKANSNGRVVNQTLAGDFEERLVTLVSMGNPHCIQFVKDVTKAPVTTEGPLIENHDLFPQRINAEFIEVVDSTNIKMRVWERGSGETYACGTGACASVVASHLNNLTGRKVDVELKGGNLFIEWDEETNHVLMTGPATTSFTGSFLI